MANTIDQVFACGPLMKGLYEQLAFRHAGGLCRARASELEPLVLDAIRAGDVVTVKGSHGSRMGPIVKAILARFPASLPKSKAFERSGSRLA